MYNIFFELLLIFFQWKPISNVTNTNFLKKEIIKSFYKNDSERAEKNLKFVLKLTQSEPELYCNLALVLYKQKKYNDAKKLYLNLQNSESEQVKVESMYHLGLISCQNADTSTAIKYFESALKLDQKHAASRFNLEFLKKTYSQGEKNMKNISKSEISVTKNNFNNIIDNKSEKQAVLNRLSKINMTENQAKILFEALGKNEIKYLTQKRQSNKTINQNYQYW